MNVKIIVISAIVAIGLGIGLGFAFIGDNEFFNDQVQKEDFDSNETEPVRYSVNLEENIGIQEGNP